MKSIGQRWMYMLLCIKYGFMPLEALNKIQKNTSVILKLSLRIKWAVHYIYFSIEKKYLYDWNKNKS